ncbi:hypothetical protein GCM10014715_86890 [Streptomyces spiralis]|uniref:Lipoprotein n=1 Tax=Streptomyces spiralis TaxID=66376 RepID=A0A919APU8_9ACTN|nr:hypothetical protein [Streptomyces spiralis]GHF18593.1 hypothetical protein GCM10014715_86890 [Streptomyces spiralis]
MVLDKIEKRAADWSVAVAFVAALTAVSGCSDNAGTVAKESPAGDSSAADPTGEGTTEAAAPQQETGDRSTPEGAVGTLVTAIIEGEKRKACSVSGTVATGSAPAKAYTASTCAGNSREVQQMNKMVDRLRPSFTPKNAKSHPTVEVSRVPVKGGKAVVPGDGINVDGQTLNTIMLSNSTGLKEGQLKVEFKATEIGGKWCVTDMKLDFG